MFDRQARRQVGALIAARVDELFWGKALSRPELSTPQIGAAETGILQIGVVEIRILQIGVAEIGTP
jgi:hypothetical protein